MQTDKGTILIVEDEPSNIDILVNILEESYDLLIAKTGEMALKRAQKAIPDLILLDVLLPDINGIEVCKKLKNIDTTKDIPVIFISALTEIGDEKHGIEAGAIDYISKPISPHILKARIENHFELKKHRDHLEDAIRLRTRDFERAKILAENASAAKDEFIANMSHELLTPLNAILLSCDLAKTTTSQNEINKIHEKVSSSAQTLLKLLYDVLEFSQASKDEFKIENLPFFLDDLIKDLNTSNIHKGVQQRMEIIYDINPKDLPNAFVGDPDKLKKILNALLDNASKFSTQSPRITLGVKPVSRNKKMVVLQFSISDNGIGIPSEEYENIFKPFYQVNAHTTRDFDGIGMGLALSRQLLSLMGGKIWVESCLNQGSTFNFTIEMELQPRQTQFKYSKLTQHDLDLTEAPPHVKVQVKNLPTANLKPIFNELKTAIQDMDPIHVKSQIGLLEQYVDQSNLSHLMNHLETYEYDEAAACLVTLAQTLNIKI